MYTLKVANIERKTSVPDDKPFLEVTVQLYKGKKKGEVRIFSYPLDTSEEALQTELKKFLDLYNFEAKQAVENKKKDEASENASKVIESMKGQKIE